MAENPKRIRLDRSYSGRDPDSNPTTRTLCTRVCSTTLKSVYLHNWWLVKLDKERIAVGGLATGEKLEETGFQSEAIVKRCDTVTLEAADGVVVVLSGLINKTRTLRNGFSSQICAHFMIGFPYFWEQHVARYHCGESACTDVKPNTNTPQISLTDLPATMIASQLMFPLEDCNDHALEHMIKSSCKNVLKHLELGKKSNTTAKEGSWGRACKRGEVKEKHDNFYELLDQVNEVTKDFTTPDRHIFTRSRLTTSSRRVNLGNSSFDAPRVGVVTRSMSRRHQKEHSAA